MKSQSPPDSVSSQTKNVMKIILYVISIIFLTVFVFEICRFFFRNECQNVGINRPTCESCLSLTQKTCQNKNESEFCDCMTGICKNIFTCITCKEGYFLQNGKCINTCLNSVHNCLTCDSPTSCYLCKEGYYLKDGDCVNQCPSAMANCHACNAPDSCYACDDGYYLWDNACIDKCQVYNPNCNFCDGPNHCTGCKIGYYSDSDGICVCLEDCLKCKSYGGKPYCLKSK